MGSSDDKRRCALQWHRVGHLVVSFRTNILTLTDRNHSKYLQIVRIIKARRTMENFLKLLPNYVCFVIPVLLA